MEFLTLYKQSIITNSIYILDLSKRIICLAVHIFFFQICGLLFFCGCGCVCVCGGVYVWRVYTSSVPAA